MSENAAALERLAGQTGGSGCGGGRGTAPSLWLFLRASLDSPSQSERQSNAYPQGFHSSTGPVDNPRPPMSRLTAKTLQKAHTRVRHLHRMGRVIPQGLALLERDYGAWRKRVQRGGQRETLLAVEDCPAEARHRADVAAMQRALDQVWADLEAKDWQL